MGAAEPDGPDLDRLGGLTVYAAVGDRLVVRSVHLDGPVRDAEILEVRGEHGSPPYVVRWSDTGHEALVFPGPDAFVEHYERHDVAAAPLGPGD